MFRRPQLIVLKLPKNLYVRVYVRHTIDMRTRNCVLQLLALIFVISMFDFVIVKLTFYASWKEF
jgi:hypothetical protein